MFSYKYIEIHTFINNLIKKSKRIHSLVYFARKEQFSVKSHTLNLSPIFTLSYNESQRDALILKFI